ncbi:hypothetical protein KEM54_002922, partial [Ascosphaera aggregata]
AAFTVHGTVQGVFFRQFTQEKAQEYGLVGWVKNESNGTVVGEVQGAEAGVVKLLKDLEKGPQHAKVLSVQHERIPVSEGSDVDFQIIRKK